RRGALGQLDFRQQARSRHEVVQEASREQLTAFGVVYSVLAEHLACALRQGAVYLALDDAVIDHDAAIADRHVRNDSTRSGAGIDLDLGDMAVVRESRTERSPTDHGKALPLRKLGERDCPPRFAIPKLAMPILHLRGLDAQLFGGEPFAP